MEDEKETGLDVTGRPQEFENAWRQESGESDDERWSRTNQPKDWVLLTCLGILQATWIMILILLEPDIG